MNYWSRNDVGIKSDLPIQPEWSGMRNYEEAHI
jgi:hypothetical protein